MKRITLSRLNKKYAIIVIALVVVVLGVYGVAHTSRTIDLELSDNSGQTSSSQPNTDTGSSTIGSTPSVAPPSSPIAGDSDSTSSPVASSDVNDGTAASSSTGGAVGSDTTTPTLVSTSQCYVVMGKDVYDQYTINSFSDGSTQVSESNPKAELPPDMAQCANNQAPINQASTN